MGVCLNRVRTILPVALLLLVASFQLHAQSGCDDSPENPTLVLGAIASAAGIGYVQIRRFVRMRRQSRDK
ncbi:MAG: PExPT-CTERM protein [Acidobacteriaceae bacterium]